MLGSVDLDLILGLALLLAELLCEFLYLLVEGSRLVVACGGCSACRFPAFSSEGGCEEVVDGLSGFQLFL